MMYGDVYLYVNFMRKSGLEPFKPSTMITMIAVALP